MYVRYVAGIKRVVPIDMGEREFSPPYVLRIFRQFGFSDDTGKVAFNFYVPHVPLLELE